MSIQYINRQRQERALIKGGYLSLVEDALILGITLRELINRRVREGNDMSGVNFILSQEMDEEWSPTELHTCRTLLEIHWNED